MNDLQDNPYESPSEPGKIPRRNRWSLARRLICWSLVSFALSMVSVVAGFQHYFYLQRGYDYRNGDSRELARLTAPADYWLIPALGFLAISLIVGVAALVVLAAKIARRR